MKKVRFTESQIKNVVKESIEKALNENAALKLNYYEETAPMVTEMARINKKESGNCIFPYELWEIKIWNNDHTPPHFHIIKDGWNVSFEIVS